jgi:RNA polymerase sigma-70 factor (ECF subfamily)
MPGAPDAAEPADATLVAAARRGDRTAFGALYRRHGRLVQAVLLARVAPDNVADLVQDVFLHALGRLDALRDGSAFAPWVATIARRRAADWRRRRRETVSLEEDPAREAWAEAPDHAEEAVDRTRAQAALAIIAGLPESYRETLLLRFVGGLSGPEIAERTGLTHGSVRVNLHRGVAMLRERLNEGSRDA